MANDPESAGLASSLTDLMTSLAVIFILLLVAMLNNQRQEAEGTRSAVLSRLEKALEIFRRQGVQVQTDPRDPLGLLVIVPEGLLRFPQGKSEIPLPGERFLRVFIPRLVGTACSSDLRSAISSIVVEGHSSSEWEHASSIERGEALNLRLSQDRSMAVVQAGMDALDPLAQGEPPGNHKCFLDFVSATGRGSAEPYPGTNGQEDKSLSRRVVFKIRVKSLEQRSFEAGAGLVDARPSGR